MRRLTTNPWITCLTAASFFFFQFFQIASFNVLTPDLVESLNTNYATLSTISSMYFYGTVLFLIPAGIILDIASPRAVILIAMTVSLVGLIMFAQSHNVYISGLGRFIIGISGGPFCFLSNVRLASRWFPPTRMALVSGIIIAIGMLGGVVSQLPFSALIELIGWQNAMWVNVGVGIFITFLIYLVVYDYPPGKQQEYLDQIAYYRTQGFAKGLKLVLMKAQNWYAGLFASLINLPIFVIGTLWGMSFLTEIHGITRTEASTICSLLFVGMLIGAPSFGYLSDKIKLRKPPMFLGAVICLLALIFAIECEDSKCMILGGLFFLIGFGSSSQALAYPVVTESNKSSFSATALGLCSTILMAGGAIIQPIIGPMVEFHYKFAFWLLPITTMLAIIAVMAIRETFCKPT